MMNKRTIKHIAGLMMIFGLGINVSSAQSKNDLEDRMAKDLKKMTFLTVNYEFGDFRKAVKSYVDYREGSFVFYKSEHIMQKDGQTYRKDVSEYVINQGDILWQDGNTIALYNPETTMEKAPYFVARIHLKKGGKGIYRSTITLSNQRINRNEWPFVIGEKTLLKDEKSNRNLTTTINDVRFNFLADEASGQKALGAIYRMFELSKLSGGTAYQK